MEFVQKVALVKIMNPDFEVWPFSGEGCEVLAAETRTNNWASGLIVANTIGVPAAGKWS